MADFVFMKDRRVWYPVTFERLQENGHMQEVTLRLKYHLLTGEQYSAIMNEKINGGDDALERLKKSFSESDIADRHKLLAERVEGWEGVVGEDKKPIPFSASFLRDILKTDIKFATAVEEGLYAASRDAPVKN